MWKQFLKILVFSLTLIMLSLFIAIHRGTPFLIALCVVLYSSGLRLILGIFFSNWLTFRLVLIFLGGIIIIFLYVSSLATLHKMVVSTPSWIILSTGIVIIAFSRWSASKTSSQFIKFNFLITNFNLNIFLVIYLLFTLLVVVKLSESFKGALGTKFF